MEELREEVKENAETRMKRSLILMEISSAEEIKISPEEIELRVRNTLEEVTNYYSEQEAKRLGSGENLQNLINRIASDEIINTTLQRIRDIAMGKEIVEDTDEEKNKEAEDATDQVEQKDSDSAEQDQSEDSPDAERVESDEE
jgi:FKBP-type peptidyl-prolyl cis-trans isomerase (trigger factor)